MRQDKTELDAARYSELERADLAVPEPGAGATEAE